MLDQRGRTQYDLASELKWITEGHSAMVVPAAARMPTRKQSPMVVTDWRLHRYCLSWLAMACEYGSARPSPVLSQS